MQEINSQLKNSILSKPIAELVPHSPPMVLIDRVLDFGPSQLHAEVDISPQSRFYSADKEGVENLVAIEYMAQTIAALAGVRAVLRDEPVKLGFLLGSRKLQLYQPVFKSGHTYQVNVEEVYMDNSGLGAFQCTISLDGELMAEAKLSVFETNDENQLLTN
ncbi:hotdog family protein [Kangiella marina]|uniref:Hotdog family protein n=1 Tax=Kangiella marina TaxID=1079178 RepID=A0ABP8IJL4_9GAMM